MQSVELHCRVNAGPNKGRSGSRWPEPCSSADWVKSATTALSNNAIGPAAIVLWNTVYLERATNAFNRHGKPVDDALLQYLSPLGWGHINLTGDYLWRSSAKLGAGKFRPLRPLAPA